MLVVQLVVQCKMQEFLLVVVLLLCSVSGYPSGPPAADYPNVVCQELSPSLQTHGPSHSGHGGYLLQLQPPLTKAFHYEPGVEYNGEVLHVYKSNLDEYNGRGFACIYIIRSIVEHNGRGFACII